MGPVLCRSCTGNHTYCESRMRGPGEHTTAAPPPSFHILAISSSICLVPWVGMEQMQLEHWKVICSWNFYQLWVSVVTAHSKKISQPKLTATLIHRHKHQYVEGNWPTTTGSPPLKGLTQKDRILPTNPGNLCNRVQPQQPPHPNDYPHSSPYGLGWSCHLSLRSQCYMKQTLINHKGSPGASRQFPGPPWQ